ncbi:MAG: hypothetical protein DI537_10510 [Stutzerimonas stutzeri]|nr:MAG: hypothetical protein DI537_10510 [Stutzerimonas stutzeri]
MVAHGHTGPAAPDTQAALVAGWAAYGINIVEDLSGAWQWQESASDEDPPDWLGILSPPFSTLAGCIADAEASLGPLPSHLQPTASKDTP